MSQPEAAISVTHSATRAITGPVEKMNASFRGAQRSLERWGALPVDGGAPTLETLARASESPHLVAAAAVETPALATRALSGPPAAVFAAFLDGIQQSRILMHHGVVPIVHGTVAATIRRRDDRRLTTHEGSPLVERALFLPRASVPAGLWDDIQMDRFDTGPVDPADAHPAALQDRARHVVQERRERLECRLAESWAGDAPLWIDGGIAKSDRVATATNIIGVVKSHRTLYVDADGLAVIAALPFGERTTVFRVTSPRRTPVLSWYLRLRDPRGRSPLWGLVRVEIADGPSGPGLSQRADTVSRWVLAEVSPIALPDPRWDTLVYGVRDCEQYLRAVC